MTRPVYDPTQPLWEHLRNIAGTYTEDARLMRDSPELFHDGLAPEAWAIVYDTIARELHRVADGLRAGGAG